MRHAVTAALLALISTPLWAVTIDGRIEPGEWQGAQHVSSFRQVQPLSGKPGSQPTEAWILATPDGLAVAFRATQPPGIKRNRQHVQRDFEDQVDRVNVMVDFDGDGRSGYDFTISSTNALFDAVITNESQFDKDWDGAVEHATSEDAGGWSAEIQIPWYTAPMHKAHDGRRTIGIYLDRVIGATGERMAWPWASFERPRFLSDFARIDVPQYGQSLLAVTPYASALYDNVHRRDKLDGGVDVFWKPNGQFQMTATLNPDFGQVESDDLVVNFGATETYFSDKRPFFTENQGIFNFGLVDDNSQLVYTRRVGGPADDGRGAGDIEVAVKLNGSIGTTNYGVLAADEGGEAGRFFGAARLTHDFGEQTLGMLLTRVERPWLDRNATVLGIDHHWRPTKQWTAWTNLVGSDVAQGSGRSHGFGATELLSYDMGGGWRQQWVMMHFDDRLQVNDFGYLSRNNFDYLQWKVQKRITELPATSAYSSHDWLFRIDGLNNDHGLRLRRQFRASRRSNLRNGGQELLQLNVNSAAWDDMLTRGHGALLLPPSMQLAFQHHAPRHGNWAWEFDADATSGGLAGNRKMGYDATFMPTYFFSDAFNVQVGLHVDVTPDWLVWQHDNLVGRFDERALQLDAGFTWSIGNRQELRMKMQAIGLDAESLGGYLVNAEGRAVASAEPVADFSLRNLGLQLRYRRELAPLSYLYVVYGRGGYALDDLHRQAAGLLGDALSLRDDEQLLVKLNYRFEL